MSEFNRLLLIIRRIFAAGGLAGLAMLTVACASTTETSVSRTATEQLLVSRAADAATEGLALPVSTDERVFVDAAYFNGEGAAYAVSSVRSAISQSGYRLTNSRDAADVIFEIRAGALSLEQMHRMLGVPSMSLPLADYRVVRLPELSLYSQRSRQGVAEFSGFLYDARSGEPRGAVSPMIGQYTIRSHRLFMVLTWGQQNVTPGERDPGRSLLEF